MKVGIIVFPGSNCDADCFHVIDSVLEQEVRYVWHTSPNLDDLDLVILPGGFSYGDYLRPGAIAACSPIMEAIREHEKAGKLVLGICNGFQILTETQMLPGALIMNTTGQFICKNVALEVNVDSPFTSQYDTPFISMPVAHNEGNYYVDEFALAEMRKHNQIVFRYREDVNGSTDNIAGVMNKRATVLGMMPHPERCSEQMLGSIEGLPLFQSIMQYLVTLEVLNAQTM